MMTNIISELEAERARVDQALRILCGNGTVSPTAPQRLGANGKVRGSYRKKAARLDRSAAAAPAPSLPSLDGPQSQAGRLRLVVAAKSGPFDVNECVAALGPDCDEGKAKACLAYWASTGDLDVVEKGRPSHPSKFQRTARFRAQA